MSPPLGVPQRLTQIGRALAQSECLSKPQQPSLKLATSNQPGQLVSKVSRHPALERLQLVPVLRRLFRRGRAASGGTGSPATGTRPVAVRTRHPTTGTCPMGTGRRPAELWADSAGTGILSAGPWPRTWAQGGGTRSSAAGTGPCSAGSSNGGIRLGLARERKADVGRGEAWVVGRERREGTACMKELHDRKLDIQRISLRKRKRRPGRLTFTQPCERRANPEQRSRLKVSGEGRRSSERITRECTKELSSSGQKSIIRSSSKEKVSRRLDAAPWKCKNA